MAGAQGSKQGARMIPMWLDSELVGMEAPIVVMKQSITNETVPMADASLPVIYHVPQRTSDPGTNTPVPKCFKLSMSMTSKPC